MTNDTDATKVIAHELSKSLVSLRLSNIYDLSTRIFLLKFAKPEHREQLLIDSGFRCHLTSFARATATTPSPFVARLRKCLRTRRVTSVSQVGTDRIIEIRFSEGAYRLYLEFYAGGNIVLTDNDLTIIGLLRNVDEGAEHERYRLGLTYNLSLRQNYGGVPPLTKERVREGLQKAIDRQQAEPNAKAAKMKKKPGDALRKALAVSISEFPPVVLEHALEVKGFDKTLPPSQVLEDDSLLDKLMDVLDEASHVIARITSADIATGYIVAKQGKHPAAPAANGDQSAGDDSKGLMYDDFHPFKPKQLEGNSANTFLEFEGFNKTVDEFFSSIEGQKLESKLHEREENAKKRIEQARTEHSKRIDGLQQVQELNVRKAQAIEANLDRVEEAIAAVNGLIAQGMDWVEISRLIEMEQSKHNPVAEMIKLPLKLEENTATILLSEYSFEEEEEMDDETDSEPSDTEDEDEDNLASASTRKKPEEKRLAIDVDLALSGWSNARQYYDQKRVAATKQEKTEQASSKALKSTEAKIQADLKKGLKQEKQVLRPVRKQMWFEKFIYFISSDGYLVLGGKDAQQNEMLYRRHLKKGDVYVHADLQGAASVIIKNNPDTVDAPIPPSTLSQAGNLSVCTSSAWDSKAVMSAWWVNADQVSKTAPTGEYLTTGGFMIRGKKNFLPPAQLLLGFAVMFQISDESKAKHVKHRFKDDATSGRKQSPSLEGKLPEAVSMADANDGFPGAGGDDDASDDEFPDADPAGAAESDDEFPDAQDDHSAEDSDSEKPSPADERSNPLQPKGQAAGAREEAAANDEEGNDSGDDDEKAGKAGATQDDAKAANTAQSGVRHLSAKERRLQKKGKTTGTSTPDTEQDASSQADRPPTKPTTSTNNKPVQQPVRGKRGKAKKAAAKYADQDEEDRRLAMQLLGSRAAEEKRVADAQQASASKETEEEARARRRAQHEQAQKEGLQAEELRRLALEDGGADAALALDGDDESAGASSLAHVESLVGMPLPGDEIVEAIPICAPWAALAKYKYKVKLQPGAQKKGKAVREIVDNWGKLGGVAKIVDASAQDVERVWPREVELIKGWKEAEIIGVVPVSKVRVMMSGGASGGGGGSGGGAGGKGKGGAKGKGGRGGKGSKKSR